MRWPEASGAGGALWWPWHVLACSGRGDHVGARHVLGFGGFSLARDLVWRMHQSMVRLDDMVERTREGRGR
jgi:hypothetical protein